jgi:cytochrome c oxidase subunit 3
MLESSSITPTNTTEKSVVHPLRFLMYLYIGTVIMIFAALTSAYLVRQAEGNWRVFEMPAVFYFSTVVIAVSSVTMHRAVVAARKNEIGMLKAMLWITSLLGILFLVSQFIGYQELVASGVYLVGNPSESFFYVITGVHALHLVGAMIALLIMVIRALMLRIHAENYLGLELTAIFWHALDLLWIYLFLFLWLNR